MQYSLSWPHQYRSLSAAQLTASAHAPGAVAALKGCTTSARQTGLTELEIHVSFAMQQDSWQLNQGAEGIGVCMFRLQPYAING